MKSSTLIFISLISTIRNFHPVQNIQASIGLRRCIHHHCNNLCFSTERPLIDVAAPETVQIGEQTNPFVGKTLVVDPSAAIITITVFSTFITSLPFLLCKIHRTIVFTWLGAMRGDFRICFGATSSKCFSTRS
jgi:hypothetical protein